MEKISVLLKKNFLIFSKNKLLIIFSILFPIVFSAFFNLIFTNYEAISKIPIAVVDEDRTDLSLDVLQNIANNQSVKILSGDLVASQKLLKSNKIEAIFVLKAGFENKIIHSDFVESVELIYLDKSAIGPALGDIVASNIILDLAIYKAANTSETYNERYALGSEDIYDKTLVIAKQLIADDFFTLSVDTSIQTPSNQVVSNLNIEDLLKRNILLGYSMIVLSFVVLFSNTYLLDEYNINTLKQLLSRGYTPVHLFISSFLSIFLSGSLIALLQFTFILSTLNIGFLSMVKILFTLLLHLLFLANLTLIFVAIVKTKIKYQSIIAPLLFLLGLLGGTFWSIEFLSKDFIWVAYLSPLYWTMKMINQTMYKGSILSIMGYYSLFVIALTLVSFFIYNNYSESVRYK